MVNKFKTTLRRSSTNSLYFRIPVAYTNLYDIEKKLNKEFTIEIIEKEGKFKIILEEK